MDYTKMRFTATRLIRDSGSAVTVTYYATSVVDAIAGTVTQTSRTESGYGVVFGSRTIDRADRIETARHHRIMLEGGVTAPSPGDRIAVDGATYTVVSCSPVSPGGTTLYHEVEVRL